MSEDLDLETIKAEAHRKLGRNIINFSKIELAFKVMLTVGHVGGTKDIMEHLQENQARLQKQTLGRLIGEFQKTMIGNGSQDDSLEDFPEGGFFLSTQITFSNADFIKKWKRNLSDLVKERNRLIHQDLAQINIASVDDHLKLISLLDEQNPRLLQQLDTLKWVIEGIQEGLNTLHEQVRSPEFAESMEPIQSEQTDD